MDSAFLLNYARRLAGMAQWMVGWYGFLGAMTGYGLGWAMVELKDVYSQFTGGMNWMAQLSGRAPVIAESFFYWGYLPYLLAAVGAVLWGARGLAKSEEMRFRAQLALHVLRLQELVKDNSNG